MIDEEVWNFIAAHHWRFARTMPWAPHEYTLRENARDQEEFDRFVRHIRAAGYRAKYGKREFSYLNVDGWKYWTMGFPVERTILINRARIAV